MTLFLSSVLILISCTCLQFLKDIDYGIFPENYQILIITYIEKIIPNSPNLIYKNWNIFKDWAIEKEKKKNIYGYSICVDIIDKKNKKYIKYWFFIRNDILYKPISNLKEKDIYYICTIPITKPEIKSTSRGWLHETYFDILNKKTVEKIIFP